MVIAPAMFCGNMVVGRATAGFIPPVALAFWRWTLVFLLMLPLVHRSLRHHRYDIRRELPDLLLLGALGMGVCGAFVYIGAATTTATNIGLIYAASPVIIILIGRFAFGEAMSRLQGAGVALALTGVLVIVLKGDILGLTRLAFVPGDLWIMASSCAWAAYSVLLRHRPTALPLMPRLAAIAACGALVMLPFVVWESLSGRVLHADLPTLGAILFLAVVPGFGAYQSHAYITRVLGASLTGLLNYLTPLYNMALSFLLLGETLHPYHIAGTVLVLAGLGLTTRIRRP
jgi:drug/metabolite transporter (DMT)-like permease